MTEIYEPQKRWYVLSQFYQDCMTQCVAVLIDEAKSRLSVNAPSSVRKCWTCSMIGRVAGMQTIELLDINPLDQSKENWQAAQDAAVVLMTERLDKQGAAIQQQLNGLKNLTAKKETQV